MVDEVITFKETITWRVRVRYDEQLFNGLHLGREALLNLREEDSAAIKQGESSGLKWVLTETAGQFHDAPEVALTAEEIIAASGYKEIDFYKLEKQMEIINGTDQI